MPVFKSPSIIIQEFDKSSIVQSLSTTEIAILYTGVRGPIEHATLTPQNIFDKIGRKNLNYTHFGLLKVLDEVDHIIAKRVIKDATYGGMVFKKGTQASISSSADITFPLVVVDDTNPSTQNNELKLTINSTVMSLSLDAATYNTISQLVAEVKRQIDLTSGTDRVLVSNTGNKLILTGLEVYGEESEIVINDPVTGSANSDLNLLIGDSSGIISGSGASTVLTDSSVAYTVDILIGTTVRIDSIDYLITDNDATTITFDSTANPVEANPTDPYDYVLVYKGTGGQIQKVSMANPESYTFLTDELFLLYNENPGAWSGDISARISSYDSSVNSFQIDLYFKNEDGTFGFTGETFTVSRDPDQKDLFGQNLYIENIINDRSNYIRVVDNATDVDYTKVPAYKSTDVVLGAGSDDTVAITDSDLSLAWDEFSNPDEIFVTVLVQNGLGGLAVWNKMINIAESRMDCVGILDGTFGMTKEDIAEQIGNIDSSYVGVYYDWQKDLDVFNNVEINLPPSVYVANRMGYTDRTREPWYPTAGTRRGRVSSLGANTVLSAVDRDFLYPRKVNPIRVIDGVGIYIWGSTTAQKRLSALSDLNIRRGLNIIEQTIARFMIDYQWEFNDEITRAELWFGINDYLQDIKQRRFMVDYKLVIDESNNTSTVINRKEMVIDVQIQPNIAAQYGLLRIFVSKQGTSANETGL